jgi:uncharacterized protein (TIGR02147 family)
MKDLFDYKDYRAYLRNSLPVSGEGRGARAKLAAHLHCQTSFISQVFNDRVHLSLEQAILVSDFLRHSEDEKKFFMLLVHKDRAGTLPLITHYQKEIELILHSREIIKNRIKIETQLQPEDQEVYYSSWHYLAIHILSALPRFKNAHDIAQRLRLPKALVDRCLKFLLERGFVKEFGGALGIGKTRIHLDRHSPLFPRHHSSWRMRSIQAVDEEDRDNLFYSGVIGIAAADYQKLKEILLRAIENTEEIIRDSKEDEAYCIGIDLFKV